MTGLEPYLALILTLSLAILSPGPAIIAAVQTAFAHGRQVALPFGIGLAVGASLWGLFALLGLAVLFQLHPGLYRGVKLLGGVYLLWMAFGMWRMAAEPLPDPARKRFGRGFWGGILLNLSNPKPALFYAALLLSLFPGPMNAAAKASIYAAALSTELFWYVVVVVTMSTSAMRRGYFGAKFWIDRLAAAALLLLGLLLIFNP